MPLRADDMGVRELNLCMARAYWVTGRHIMHANREANESVHGWIRHHTSMTRSPVAHRAHSSEACPNLGQHVPGGVQRDL